MQTHRKMKSAVLLCAAIAAAVAVVVVVAYINRNPLRKSFRAVEYGAWVGYSEASIRQMFGPPMRAIAGYERVGAQGAPTPPGPYQTLVYEHPKGYLYVWFNSSGNGGSFVCFDSIWFDREVQF